MSLTSSALYAKDTTILHSSRLQIEVLTVLNFKIYQNLFKIYQNLKQHEKMHQKPVSLSLYSTNPDGSSLYAQIIQVWFQANLF